MAKSKLGKGLDSLIPGGASSWSNVANDTLGAPVKETAPVKKVKSGEKQIIDTTLKVSDLVPNKEQPRRYFDEDSLQELADNIKQRGVIVPLLVVEDKDDSRMYMIIAGERRWRASQVAGIKEVPARVLVGFSQKELVEIALIDNIQRQDLNPIEEAKAYQKLIDDFNMKQDEVAERVSKSRVSITNSLRLLKLCDEVQQMLVENLISSGHARALLGIDNDDKQLEIAQRVMDEKLSVREVEKIVKNISKPQKAVVKPEVDESLMAVYRDIEEKLKQKFNTKVVVTGKGDGSGKIELEFYTNDDMERILEMLR